MRLGGGVDIMEMSRAPNSENCSVRGMGVAVSVRVSTSLRSMRIFSLAPTPNFCSSSMTSRPRSRNIISLPRMRWVPMSMSILPSRSRCAMSRTSLAVFRRLINSILHGKSLRRALKV